LESKFTIGVVLLRLGSYAVGVFRGDTLMSSKVGTGLVHSRHKKGGSSARRFERHREKQMEYFFDRVCVHVREQLEPMVRDLDYVIYGGERYNLLEFRKQCQFLRRLDDRTLDTLANVRRPRQATLEAAIHLVWSSLVIKWQ
jgi:peptide subunit release factor 1 (eRF1)